MNNFIEIPFKNEQTMSQLFTPDSSYFAPSINYNSLALNQHNAIESQQSGLNREKNSANMLLQKLRNYWSWGTKFNGEIKYFPNCWNTPSQNYSVFSQDCKQNAGHSNSFSNYQQESVSSYFNQDSNYFQFNMEEDNTKMVRYLVLRFVL